MQSTGMNPECHWVQTPDGHLFAQTWSPSALTSRVPIVLLHDSLGCVALWRSFPEALCEATGHPVIAYDRLGFGRSNASPRPPSFSFINDEATHGFAALRKALSIERFIALGHSVGGGMAVHIAGTYPDKCQGLVTIAAQAFNEGCTREGIIAAQELFADPAQFAKLTKYHGDKASWVLSAWTKTWLSPAFADWTLDAALKNVTCPALVLHGEKDEYGSLRQPERIASRVKGPAQCEILPHIHHVPHRECEADVVARVTHFVRAL
ncbi:alpha/beta fold hydrolase [Vreelandella massiliensis]|uniref:alpha/beta fold hydrolase n=1 Tax=Vreelandella massiliensis TaxID=1816686 RepID=UPI0011817EA7|nr:alpha/beta hydrolase [Halomonas massiliensis]